jgi:enoyl-CoA hydratase/carnithine racemase
MSEMKEQLAPDAVVQLRRAGEHVAVVTLNRPQARNAVSEALTQRLDRAVQAVEADPSIRVAVLTGAGHQAFCAGADLKDIAAGKPWQSRFTDCGGFAGFVDAPRKKLWIAAVNGPALAGGFELMLACDLAVAASHAVFGLPEVKRGLAAAAGGMYRLPRVLPRALALELLVTGDTIDAQRALSFGLVNRVVAPEDVLPQALEIARGVNQNAPMSVQWSLEVGRRALDADEAELRRHSLEIVHRVHQSEDAREGARAFAEKRAPLWKGR